MKEQVKKEWELLLNNYPQLSSCADDALKAYELIKETVLRGGLILTCGNGGSAADAEHITGELMKGFKMKRPVTAEQRDALVTTYHGEGVYFADHLQRAIPAISLVSQTSLSSAFVNDVAPDMVFAQQVFGYGCAGDVLLALTTSGNSKNVVNACKVAKVFGITTIGLTGEDGGDLKDICDITIRVPASETFRVQEFHLPLYHALCAMIERELFE